MPNAMASAVFAVIAKDAASKVLGGIGKSMARLKGAAGAAFKAIAVGAVAAAGAIAGLTIASIKGAIEDEKATIRLNAALRARGFNLDALGPKVDEQIKAMQRLGITDDEVRDGLEVGSRFFKNQNNLLKANATAANIAAATGKPLATVMLALGRGAQGSTRGLASLGIEVEKGAKLKDILRAADEKYLGVADEIANSTAGKFAAAQIDLNEQFEAFGARFLPAVSAGLDFFTANVLPKVEEGLTFVGDKIFEVGKEISKPGGMLESVGKVGAEFIETLKPGVQVVADALGPFIQAVLDLAGALWGDGNGPLAAAVKFIGEALNNLFKILGPILDLLTAIITAISGVVKGAQNLGSNPKNNQGFQFSGGATPGTGNGFQYGGTSTGGAIVVRNNITFGNDAVSHIDTKLGQSYSYGGSRTNP